MKKNIRLDYCLLERPIYCSDVAGWSALETKKGCKCQDKLSNEKKKTSDF